MGILCGILALVASLASLVYSVKFLISIFRTSGPLWGIGSLVLPVVSLVWLVQNWSAGKDTFLKSLGLGILSGVFSATGALLAQG